MPKSQNNTKAFKKRMKGSTVTPVRHVHTEIRTSAEFHAQHRKSFVYRESAGTKRNLEKSGVVESRLRRIDVSIKFRVLLQKLGVPQQLKKFPAF
jgi:hypothetical protein